MNRLLRPLAYSMFCAFLLAATAQAQDGNDFGGVPVARPFQAGVGLPMPGRVWIGGSAANNGIGYQGSYFSAGMVTDLGQDFFDGDWSLDARAHITQGGLLLGNFGMMRGIPFEQFNADLRAGVFYDIDADKADNFGHTFHQIGITGEFLSDYFDVRANGYIPIGANDFQFGTPGQCFIGNNILVQNGIDSALEGFDLKAGFKPGFAQPVAGTLTLGGYYYRSDIVEPFGGFSGGLSAQPIDGVTTIFQINHDDRFQTTGLLGVQLHYGGSRNRGASRQAREATPVQRNDHIVRVHQDPIFATNPATGALFNVIHVDNSAAAGGDGTVERPFTSLAAAQAASAPNDVIFVREGLSGPPTNDLTGLENGIVLQNGQFFLGDGVAHFINTVEVGLFQLCNDIDGLRPTITNAIGPAVTLANDNTVAGFNIGNAAQPAAIGIQGTGTNNASIRDNVINGALTDAIRITNGTGVFDLTRNTLTNNFGAGINIIDSAGTFNITESTITGNGGGATGGVNITKNGGAPLVVNVSTSTLNLNGTGVFASVTGAGAQLTTNVFDNLSINNNLSNGVTFLAAGGATHIGLVDGNTTIDGNETGVFAEASGLGTIMNTTITDNLAISNNFLNGIEVRSTLGASHTALIDGNLAINGNGVLGGAGGTGIVVRVLDGGVNTSLMNATITDNNLANNVGGLAGTNLGTHIFSDVVGNANLVLLAERNVMIGGPTAAGGGAGMHFNFNVAGNALNNFVTLRDNVLTGIGNDDGIRFDAAGSTRLGAIITRNVIATTGGDGIDLRGTGTSISQFQLTNNTITGATNNGLQASVVGGGGAAMIVEVVDNLFTGNTGVGINLELGQIAGVANANTNGDLIALIRNNSLAPNGAVNDVTATMEATVLATSSIIMQMTNNVASGGILLTKNPVVAPPDFRFENGGGNQPANPTTAGAGAATIDLAAPAGTTAAAATAVPNILPLLP